MTERRGQCLLRVQAVSCTIQHETRTENAEELLISAAVKTSSLKNSRFDFLWKEGGAQFDEADGWTILVFVCLVRASREVLILMLAFSSRDKFSSTYFD